MPVCTEVPECMSFSPANTILFKALINVTKETSFMEGICTVVTSLLGGLTSSLQRKRSIWLHESVCSIFVRIFAETESYIVYRFCMAEDQTLLGEIFGFFSDLRFCSNSWVCCWHSWWKFQRGGSSTPSLIRAFNAKANDVICNHTGTVKPYAPACCYLGWRYLCF